MDVSIILPWIQIVLSVGLVVLILLQSSSDAGVGTAFGDGGGGNYHTRRGFERTIFIATIIVSILLGVSAIASLLII